MSIRERVRAALTSEQEFRSEPPAWPQTRAAVVVEDLIEAAQRLDHAAELGEVVDRSEAQRVVNALSEYISALPETDQARLARRLVSTLAKRHPFAGDVRHQPSKL